MGFFWLTLYEKFNVEINKNQRERLLKAILGMSGYRGRFSDDLLSFLSRIWSLRDLPGADSSGRTLYDDIQQHMIRNDDWEENHLYVDILKILEANDELFRTFIETVVNPEVRRGKEEIIQYVSILNTVLNDTGMRLVLSDYFEELPVYKLRGKTEINDLPVDIGENKIPFYKARPKSTYPCFVLRYDNWDDYGYRTLMDLAFHPNESQAIDIGRVKIYFREHHDTWDVIPDEFTRLGADFCSIGQSRDYYDMLKKLLGPTYQSVLFALRDAAMFPRIHEQFEFHQGFEKSLLRSNAVEQMLRTLRYELNGMDPRNCFIFTYTCTPPYSTDQLKLFFDFKYNSDLDHRVYALIGKNGTGKTRILSSLAKDLSNRNAESISPKRPLYAKVFTVSYSYFDRFAIQQGDAEYNYVYCGLKKSEDAWLTAQELIERFHASSLKIIEKDQVNDWYNTLKDFIPEDLLNRLFRKSDDYRFSEKYVFVQQEFEAVHQQLSSGQNILVFIITEILSQIRYNSLILYDEPETHLHPNAISSLMYAVFNLVKRFNSFCILATHSPIVIQEIPSRNIFVIVRDNARAELRRLEKESFGENLTVITDDIFGNREIAKHQYQVLEQLVNSGKTYEEILQTLQSDNLPIALSTRLFVKGLMEKKTQ
jgi:predicted ATPase